MGRKIRRVPLDFDWPIREVWKGFLNEHYKRCPGVPPDVCVGGQTAAAQWFDSVVRLIVMLGDEAIESAPEYREHHARTSRIYPHPYLEGWAQAPRTSLPQEAVERLRALRIEQTLELRLAAQQKVFKEFPPRLLPLTSELAAFVQGLGGGNMRSSLLGHFDSFPIAQALRRAAGVDEQWGICTLCKGDATDPTARAAAEAWTPTPPPTGDGWQLWETTTEGSPVSPVLPTREAFIEWLVSMGGQTRAAAEAFTTAGWCPSGIIVTDGPQAGVYENIESSVLMTDHAPPAPEDAP